MTIPDRNLATTVAAIPDNGPMRWFAQIGALLLVRRLLPLPDVHDLLWRYTRERNHSLSLAVDRAVAAGGLDLGTIGDMRRAHCGDMNAKNVSPRVETAHAQAETRLLRIERGAPIWPIMAAPLLMV
jgi:diguanylate cyclase